MAGKAKRKKAAATPEQSSVLEELKAVAEKLGLKVREEKLLREVGYRVRSGRCRVGEDQVIFIDRNLSPDSQIDVLLDELASESLDDVYVSPATRALLDRVSGRGVSRDGEGDSLVG